MSKFLLVVGQKQKWRRSRVFYSTTGPGIITTSQYWVAWKLSQELGLGFHLRGKAKGRGRRRVNVLLNEWRVEGWGLYPPFKGGYNSTNNPNTPQSPDGRHVSMSRKSKSWPIHFLPQRMSAGLPPDVRQISVDRPSAVRRPSACCPPDRGTRRLKSTVSRSVLPWALHGYAAML